MRKQEQIQLIMDAFDFKKVHSVMTFLNIKWRYENGDIKIPTIDDLKGNALFCLNKVSDSKESNTSLNAGGLETIKVNGALGLKFNIEYVHPLYPLTNKKDSDAVERKA